MKNIPPHRFRTIQERAKSVPLVEGGELIDVADTLAFMLALKRQQSQIPRHTFEQVNAVYNEVEPDIAQKNDYYVLNATELRGIIARAALRGAAQAVNDIGETYRQASIIKSIVEGVAIDHEPTD